VVTRRWKSKKDRQYNGQKKKDKETNNDLHNTTQKMKDIAIQTSHKIEVHSGVPEGKQFLL
jgi:hypothetical protein